MRQEMEDPEDLTSVQQLRFSAVLVLSIEHKTVKSSDFNHQKERLAPGFKHGGQKVSLAPPTPTFKTWSTLETRSSELTSWFSNWVLLKNKQNFTEGPDSRVCGGFRRVLGSHTHTLPAPARLWSSAFCWTLVYLVEARCREDGQWAGRSTAQPEWGGAPLSAAPWTQHTSEGLWLRAQRATSGSKAQRKPLHLSNKKKWPEQSERAASCWHHTSVISGGSQVSSIPTPHPHIHRRQGVSLLTPHSGEPSSVGGFKPICKRRGVTGWALTTGLLVYFLFQ